MAPLRYDGRNVRWIQLTVAAAALALVAAACGDAGGPSAPTPEGPTTVSLTKTVVDEGQGELRFTLTLTNEGENAAVNIATSDFWEEGLEVTAIGSVEDQQPKAIEDRGMEFILREFAAGEGGGVGCTARRRGGGG